MKPSIQTSDVLAADQVVTASVTLVTIGLTGNTFSFSLPATKRATVKCFLPFSVGASGGFKFQLTSSQTLVSYQVGWEIIDGVTASPGATVAADLVAQSAIANAFASVAGNHICNMNAGLKGHATLASTITIQFACNSAAGAITILQGASIVVNQYLEKKIKI